MIKSDTIKPSKIGPFIANEDRLPTLICCKCLEPFKYRGECDNQALEGSEMAICNNCLIRFSGGPYDNYTVGDIFDYK